MGIFNSFSCNTPLFEKSFFYLFSSYLILRAGGTLIWSIIMQLNIPYAFTHIDTLKKGVLAWTNILIGVCVVVIIFDIICGIYSVVYFDNAKIRSRCTNVTCMTVTFAIVFLCILIVQTAVAVNIITFRSTFITDFKNAFWNYEVSVDSTKFVDDVQRSFYCCGIYSYRDYLNEFRRIPDSCCNDHDHLCSSAQYRFGCETEIFIRLYGIYSMGVFTMTFSIVEFVGLIWALYLTNSIRKRNVIKRQEMFFKQGLQYRNNAQRF
ncbi:hypothetical protein PUN28_014863 [Cardiocondyla obscurior]|uniref:Tetraspanin n=1 Tax=Cardiocondyla obscurior TaxID=286306 RepID=A0AAW2EZK8_9HYME